MAHTAGDVALVNAALALLGAGRIASFDDTTILDGGLAPIYDTTVAALLASYPWRFTLRKGQLSRLTAAPANEWTYQHDLPADMLVLRALFPSATARSEDVVRDYEVFENRVLSDQSELWADYQVAKPPEAWPPLFYKMATHALASDLAQPVSGSSSLAEEHLLKAFGTPSERGTGGYAGQARRADAQQQPPQRTRRFLLVEARFGGR